MAGTLTLSYSETRSPFTVTFTWVSDASGDVSGNAVTKDLLGILLRAVHIPDSGGTQPTDAYDVLINDEHGIDVLQGTGADISNAAASDFFPALTDGSTNSGPTAVNGTLDLVVSNAGNAKGGSVVLYLR